MENGITGSLLYIFNLTLPFQRSYTWQHLALHKHEKSTATG
jgi:hypothetical protein